MPRHAVFHYFIFLSSRLSVSGTLVLTTNTYVMFSNVNIYKLIIKNIFGSMIFLLEILSCTKFHFSVLAKRHTVVHPVEI
jgi:hypothetical protein